MRLPGQPMAFLSHLDIAIPLCVRVRACGSQGQPQVLSSSAVRSDLFLVWDLHVSLAD